MQKKKKTLKVACVVKIKLLFYGLVLLQFDNTDYLMQNTIQKFRRSSIVFKKPGNFDKLQLPYSSIIFAETLHTCSTYQCL